MTRVTRQICIETFGSGDHTGQMSLRSLHCKNILMFSYILRHIMPLYSNLSIRVQNIELTIF